MGHNRREAKVSYCIYRDNPDSFDVLLFLLKVKTPGLSGRQHLRTVCIFIFEKAPTISLTLHKSAANDAADWKNTKQKNHLATFH